MSETYNIPNLALTVGTLLLLYITIFTFIVPAFSAKNKFWKSHPWAGESKEWFAGLRAQLTTIKDTRSLLKQGYEKVGSSHQPQRLAQTDDFPVWQAQQTLHPAAAALGASSNNPFKLHA